MKTFIGLLTLVCALSATASSKETKNFFYDGSRNSIELTFQGEKTHTEYRIERRQSICYRHEYAGMRTICTGGGYSPRHCTTQPQYRTVAYSCYENVSVPYEVFDHYVDARVIVDVTNKTGLPTTGESINVTLEGDHLTFNAIGSKKFFLISKEKDVQTGFNGNTKFIDAVLAVELKEAAPLLTGLKMENLSVDGKTLKFDTNLMKNIGVNLMIERKKLLGDEIVFARDLTSEEVQINGPQAEVNFLRLGFELGQGKYEITATSKVKFEGSILNSDQFKELSASKKLIYRVR